RARAVPWLRLLERGGHERTPYEASTSLPALTRRGSSLLHPRVQAASKLYKPLDRPPQGMCSAMLLRLLQLPLSPNNRTASSLLSTVKGNAGNSLRKSRFSDTK